MKIDNLNITSDHRIIQRYTHHKSVPFDSTPASPMLDEKQPENNRQKYK